MPKIRVYLAGPISNCNHTQRTEWCKQLKAALDKLGYDSIDPARHTTDTRDDWTPLREMIDMDRCDVVIRESLARVHRYGRRKPVILNDH